MPPKHWNQNAQFVELRAKRTRRRWFMGKKIPRSMVLLITVSFAVVFATFDLLVEAQDPVNQNANSNTQNSNTMRTRGSRRGGAKAKSKAAATTGVTPDSPTATGNRTQPAIQT